MQQCMWIALCLLFSAELVARGYIDDRTLCCKFSLSSGHFGDVQRLSAGIRHWHLSDLVSLFQVLRLFVTTVRFSVFRRMLASFSCCQQCWMSSDCFQPDLRSHQVPKHVKISGVRKIMLQYWQWAQNMSKYWGWAQCRWIHRSSAWPILKPMQHAPRQAYRWMRQSRPCPDDAANQHAAPTDCC